MLAVFNFTVDEGKKLIAKGVANLPAVKKALKDGIIAIHYSTSSYFLVPELTGESVDTDGPWLAGIIVPKAMCVHENTQRRHAPGSDTEHAAILRDAGSSTHTIVIEKGKRVYGKTLRDLYENMGKNDVYVKGVNCYDADGYAGVLIGSADENGTIGRMYGGHVKNGYPLVACAGNEKFIPGSVKDAAGVVKGTKDYAMGINVKLFPFKADEIMTEAKALETVTGVKATVISAGGLAGAQGGVCVAVEGDKSQVDAAGALAESLKGAQLPPIKGPDCDACDMPTCSYLHGVGSGKSWIGK